MTGRVASVLGQADLLPYLRVVTVGAAFAGRDPSWQPLVAAGLAEAVAFEPDEAACNDLVAQRPQGWVVVPEALGDGNEHTLHLCRSQFCASLLEPDLEMARLFTGLVEHLQPIGSVPVRTRRLDDVPEAAGASWISLDVQGAELLILEHGQRVLSGCQFVELEVQFIPQYHGAPGLAEVDAFMRRHGFVLHTIGQQFGRAYAPALVGGDRNSFVNQHLWADLVYVRDVRRLGERPSTDLLALALLADSALGSIDLAHLALATFDARHGTTLASKLAYGDSSARPAAPAPGTDHAGRIDQPKAADPLLFPAGAV